MIKLSNLRDFVSLLICKWRKGLHKCSVYEYVNRCFPNVNKKGVGFEYCFFKNSA